MSYERDGKNDGPAGSLVNILRAEAGIEEDIRTSTYKRYRGRVTRQDIIELRRTLVFFMAAMVSAIEESGGKHSPKISWDDVFPSEGEEDEE